MPAPTIEAAHGDTLLLAELQVIFERQRLILATLEAFGGVASKRDVLKSLLLYCTESEQAPSYGFVPYKNGAFSFTAYADARKLIEKGYISDSPENAWTLLSAGRSEVAGDKRHLPAVTKFLQNLGGVSGEQLVTESYIRHPYYAINSSMAHRLLKRHPEALAAVRAAKPDKAGPGLRTIGYEGKSLEEYLNKLILGGVSLLCDVRRNPLSRKYGFSRKTLSHACEEVGIRYEHIPELGIASDERQSLRTQSDYDELFARYEATALRLQAEPLARILGWITDGNCVALTCFELEPHQCHRHCVAEELERMSDVDLELSHL